MISNRLPPGPDDPAAADEWPQDAHEFVLTPGSATLWQLRLPGGAVLNIGLALVAPPGVVLVIPRIVGRQHSPLEPYYRHEDTGDPALSYLLN